VRVGGIVVRIDGTLRFLSSTVALRVEPTPRVTAVPGAPSELLGITMHEGAVVAVLALGSGRAEMIVCRHSAELIGLVGPEVVHVGLFDAADGNAGAVRHEGHDVLPLDLAMVYRRVQSGYGPTSLDPGTGTVLAGSQASPRNVRHSTT